MQKNGNHKNMDMRGRDQESLLEEFFVEELKDIYWAERHLTKELPKMQKAATTEELKDAFGNHLEQTKNHVSRLEEIFSMLDRKPVSKKCDAIVGITKEGSNIINETDAETMTRDVGLIIAAQKAEHYEIATYGGLMQLARTLNREDIAGKLQETLGEEKEADAILTNIAEDHINVAASHEKE